MEASAAAAAVYEQQLSALIQPRAMSNYQQRQQQQHEQQFFESASDHEDQEQEQYDPLSNLLSLQLRKPAHWNLELSTSRSCSNIALPRIILYDHKGVLLLDVDGQDEKTYRPTTNPRRKLSSATHRSDQDRLPNEFHGLYIGEATPTPSPTHSNRLTPIQSPIRQQLTGSCIDFSTHELPDWHTGHEAVSSRSSSSLRGVHFKDQEHSQSQSQQQVATPPSTSTLTTTANSSSSGIQEKRRYRRTHSSGQRSILERFSMSRGRFSSPEQVQEETIEHAPRYFLRSSKAGTLVIKDESFSRVRQRRRRYRGSSSENVLIQQDRSPSESVVQIQPRRHLPHLQRSREPAGISTSEDEGQAQVTRQSRSRRHHRNCGKDEAKFITVDPGNYVLRASTGATAR